MRLAAALLATTRRPGCHAYLGAETWSVSLGAGRAVPCRTSTVGGLGWRTVPVELVWTAHWPLLYVEFAGWVLEIERREMTKKAVDTVVSLAL